MLCKSVACLTERGLAQGSTIAVVQNKDRGYFKRMCGEIQVKDVEIIGPPGPKAVMEASAKQVCHTIIARRPAPGPVVGEMCLLLPLVAQNAGLHGKAGGCWFLENNLGVALGFGLCLHHQAPSHRAQQRFCTARCAS